MDAFKELSNGTPLFTPREGPFALATSGNVLGRWWNSGGQASELCQNNTNTDTQTQHRLTDPQLEVIETVLVDLLQLVPQGKRELNQRLQVPPVAG